MEGREGVGGRVFGWEGVGVLTGFVDTSCGFL
jgi:hypothetical protein